MRTKAMQNACKSNAKPKEAKEIEEIKERIYTNFMQRQCKMRTKAMQNAYKSDAKPKEAKEIENLYKIMQRRCKMRTKAMQMRAKAMQNLRKLRK
jgi:hypothetical protein